jgi:hypothetical protein
MRKKIQKGTICEFFEIKSKAKHKKNDPKKNNM